MGIPGTGVEGAACEFGVVGFPVAGASVDEPPELLADDVFGKTLIGDCENPDPGETNCCWYGIIPFAGITKFCGV